MRISSFLVSLAVILISAAIASAQSVELRMKDGSLWRGSVGDQVDLRFMEQGVAVPMTGQLTKVADLYIVVKGTIGGLSRDKTIFRADIVSMKTTAAAKPEDTPVTPAPSTTPQAPAPADSSATAPAPSKDAPAASNQKLGVFVLPLNGEVGETMRHNEIDMIGKEADKYGPGQIIILDIDSPGGLLIEMEQIHNSIVELRKRHRVIAWIRRAISAAAASASNCNEIYFRTTGTLGAMTAFGGGVSLKGKELEKWLDTAGKWMESGGRSKYIAWAMIDDEALLSYDKDPKTGEVTWHNDLSGEVKLSDAVTNLTFTATTATQSGFADGIADTNEEMAKLLNLPKWNEISDYGRRIAAEWQRTVDQAHEEIPKLMARVDYAGQGSGDPVVVTGKRLQIINDLMRWWDRCPNVCFLSNVPPKSELERISQELRRQLANMKR